MAVTEAHSALSAGSALEVLRRRFPETVVDRGDDVRQRPAIGGFRTRREAREALPFTESGYVVIPFPDARGRWWLSPLERAFSPQFPGYVMAGPWGYAPRWVGEALS